MVNVCAPCILAIQIHHGIQRVRAHKKEKKAFRESMPILIDRQCASGNLEPVQGNATGKGGAASSWRMTAQGIGTGLAIYHDIRTALEQYGLASSPEARAALGLDAPLSIHANGAPGNSLQSRIGERWPSRVRNQIIRSRTLDPFATMPKMTWLGTARTAMGLVRKATRSGGFVDLLLPRLVILAHLCGIGEGGLDYDDLMALAIHSQYYEKLARACVAALVGTIDKSVIANIGFGPLVDGQPLGSTENPPTKFAESVGAMTGALWQVGTVSRGEVLVTYPKPLEQLSSIKFDMHKKSDPKEGEPVFMLAGWAASLALRPPPVDTGSQNNYRAIYYDIHGSPLYGDWVPPTVKISVKRLPDGRLVGKPSEFGSWKAPEVTGQGVFGQACGCTQPIPARRLDGLSMGGEGMRFNGVDFRTFESASGGEFRYGIVYVSWEAGDVVSQIHSQDRWAHSTYIQGRGECLWCAAQRTLGTGCSFLVAGGR